MRIHLDTDLGGDSDDVCALAMLLGWPGVELVGLTTTIDPGGRRAGYAGYCLEIAGRRDVPMAAGAEVSLTTRRVAEPVVGDERYWPLDVPPRPGPAGVALDMLTASIEQGATVVAIGPYTNLALLEVMRPGSLAKVPVVLMGGWVDSPGEGLPAWGPDMDFNVQWDTAAAQLVFSAAGDLTLVTLPATMSAHLRARDLSRLRAAGPLGALIARQGVAHGVDFDMPAMGRSYAGLPDDLLNFQYDPVACAVALDWPGATVVPMKLRVELVGDHLRWWTDDDGSPVKVVESVDGQVFAATWLDAVESAGRAGQPHERM